MNQETARLIIDNVRPATLSHELRLERGASRITAIVGATEVASTRSLIEASRNMTEMLVAFAEAGVAPEVDQGAVQLAYEGVGLAVQTRAKNVELHQRLLAMGRKLNIDPTSWGDCDPYKQAFTTGYVAAEIAANA